MLGVWRDSLNVEFVQLYALQRPVGTERPSLAESVARWSGGVPTFQRVAGAAAEAASETLKMMAGSEEMFYSRRGHYTSAFDSLREVSPRFVVPETVRLSPLWVEDNGWMYMALEMVADATCIISYGFVHLMGRPGDPNEGSKEILVGFGATYESTAHNAFMLNPSADKDSLM